MSYDNWAICPRCEKQALKEKEKLNQKASEAYGKVSASEYLALVNESKNSFPVEETLGYAIGIYEGELELFISYRCSCSVCGFSYSFEHAESLTL